MGDGINDLSSTKKINSWLLDAIKPSEINVQNIGYFKLTLLYSIGILTINPNDPRMTKPAIIVLLICMSIMVCGSYSLPTASAKPKVQDGGQTLFDSDQSLFTSDRSNTRYKCYSWSQNDLQQIRQGKSSQEIQKKTCEGHSNSEGNFVFSQGVDSKAPGCGSCWCCQPDTWLCSWCWSKQKSVNENWPQSEELYCMKRVKKHKRKYQKCCVD